MGLALGLGLGYVKEVGSAVITRISYVAKGGRDKNFPQNKKKISKTDLEEKILYTSNTVCTFCKPQVLYVYFVNLKYCMHNSGAFFFRGP